MSGVDGSFVFYVLIYLVSGVPAVRGQGCHREKGGRVPSLCVCAGRVGGPGMPFGARGTTPERGTVDCGEQLSQRRVGSSPKLPIVEDQNTWSTFDFGGTKTNMTQILARWEETILDPEWK